MREFRQLFESRMCANWHACTLALGPHECCLSAFQSLKDFHQTYTNEHSRSCYNVIYSKSRLRPFVPFGHVFGLPSSIVEVGFDRRYINE
ncbi:hypothetical protein RV134_290056 [Roseovarius sp. EC-HK134]|nr:hypothetical protein RV134_290056 [Roseovarius sp. EC-HK134]VVT18100.1 hypothetical protein RV420_360051 [Roseovarius sp. EC-SD190]